MVSLDEKRKRRYSDGDIIFVDSNFSRGYDCFGVVVEKDFWMKQVEKENVFKENVEEIFMNHGSLDERVLFRVLGTRAFIQIKRAENEKGFTSGEDIVMHYRCQLPVYVDPVNLKPLINLSKIDAGQVGKVLFSGQDSYILEVLNEAEVIYDYLHGKRFDTSSKDFFSKKKGKLLRLLEQAIPINK